MSKIKPIILVSSLIVMVLGGVYMYQMKRKRSDETDSDELVEIKTNKTEPVKNTSTTINLAPKTATTKPVNSTVTAPPRTNTGFAQPQTGPVSVSVKAPAIGAKIFVLSNNGANAYKTAQASTTNVYKFYKKGAYIGTYLGKEGTMFSKIIAEENPVPGISLTTNKVVFVPSKDITF